MTWLLTLHFLTGDIVVPEDLVSFHSEERCVVVAMIVVRNLTQEGYQFQEPAFTCVRESKISPRMEGIKL
jgi:hypothetical protein